MKTELRTNAPDGGVTVFHEPPVKCSITGHGAVVAVHVAVDAIPPPTAHTSPLLTMNTEFRSFNVPIATPLVHMNPFQWIMVGSEAPSVSAFPTAHPSFGLTGVKGGPNEIEFKVLRVGLVTVPQLTPSQCPITSSVPTVQPSLAVTWKTERKSKEVVGEVGTRLIGSFVHVPPE